MESNTWTIIGYGYEIKNKFKITGFNTCKIQIIDYDENSAFVCLSNSYHKFCCNKIISQENTDKKYISSTDIFSYGENHENFFNITLKDIETIFSLKVTDLPITIDDVGWYILEFEITSNQDYSIKLIQKLKIVIDIQNSFCGYISDQSISMSTFSDTKTNMSRRQPLVSTNKNTNKNTNKKSSKCCVII